MLPEVSDNNRNSSRFNKKETKLAKDDTFITS
jgi:hypothetical protein